MALTETHTHTHEHAHTHTNIAYLFMAYGISKNVFHMLKAVRYFFVFFGYVDLFFRIYFVWGIK